MGRYRTFTERDSLPEILGDKQFIGVNMRLYPGAVPEGYVSEAINCRFNRGVVETRKGFSVPQWANRHLLITGTVATSQTITGTGINVTAQDVIVFSATDTSPLVVGARVFVVPVATSIPMGGINASIGVSGVITQITTNVSYRVQADPIGGIHYATVANYPAKQWVCTIAGAASVVSSGVGGNISWGTIYGIGVFKDPTTFRELLIVATAAGIYYTSQNNIPYPLALPSGVVVDGPVTFTQAFDTLIMHRGKTKSALKLSDTNSAWTEIAQSPNGTGTDVIPNGERSLFFQNRLFIPCRNDEVAASDFNDFTRYLPVFQEFRINQGSADKLVTITKFNDTTLIAFKEQSIYAVYNVYGNLAAMQLDQLSDRFGCAAAKSVAAVGNDLWFLSGIGVMSLKQTEQNKLQGVVTPISEPIQPLIDRINWKYASNATAAYTDNKYYLAVPLDSAENLGYEQSPIGITLTNSQYAIATTPGTLYRVRLPGTATGETHWLGGPTPTQMVVSGTNLVTVTTSFPHTLVTGDTVLATSLATSPAIGLGAFGNKVITVTGASTFTYAVVGLVNGTYTDKAVFALKSTGRDFSRDFLQSKDYTAEGDYLIVIFGASAIASVSCKKLTLGVNNAVLVYDFMNQAWSGYDQSDGLTPTDFAVYTVNNRKRLLFCDINGYIKLYEDTFDEQIPQPSTDWVYVDATLHDPLDTIQVNGGTVVTINPASSDNGATSLGTASASLTPKNWSVDSLGNYGFYRGAFLAVWLAPNTFPVPITNGIRFWSTNGLAPSILYNLGGLGYAYPSGIARIITNTTTQITSSVTTRGYMARALDVETPAWVSLDLSTWAPNYTISLLGNGEAEDVAFITARTKDRAKWYKPFDKVDFESANSTGRAMDDFRQDCSLLLASPYGSGATGEATSFSLPATAGGVNVERHQNIRETMKTILKDTLIQVKISNTTGRFRLLSALVELRKFQTHVPAVS